MTGKVEIWGTEHFPLLGIIQPLYTVCMNCVAIVYFVHTCRLR